MIQTRCAKGAHSRKTWNANSLELFFFFFFKCSNTQARKYQNYHAGYCITSVNKILIHIETTFFLFKKHNKYNIICFNSNNQQL